MMEQSFAPQYPDLKVGDLIKWDHVMHDDQEECNFDIGLVLDVRKNVKQDYHGYDIQEALVQFDNEIIWLNTIDMEKINNE